MEYPALILLKRRDLFWKRVREGDRIGRTVLSFLFFIVGASAVYGVVLAGWRSPLLPYYVAVKLPMLLVGTTSLVMLLNWIFAVLFGSGLSFKQVVAITYGAMTVTCWILLSLVPVTILFTYGVASYEGTHAQQQLTHNYLLLTHITIIAIAGVMGNSALRTGLKETVAPACSPRRVYWSWIVSFAVVGCQLSWILRPFIGSPFFDVRFMRPNALERNFFEFIFGEVLPYVLKGG